MIPLDSNFVVLISFDKILKRICSIPGKISKISNCFGYTSFKAPEREGKLSVICNMIRFIAYGSSMV